MKAETAKGNESPFVAFSRLRVTFKTLPRSELFCSRSRHPKKENRDNRRFVT
jgi:hypothetical protein